MALKKPLSFRRTLVYVVVIGVVAFYLSPRSNNIEGEGSLEPRVVRNVSVQSSGTATVKEIHVQSGEFVRAGQKLCTLEDPLVFEKVRRLKTELAVAKGEVDTYFTTLHTSSGNLEIDEKQKITASKRAKYDEYVSKKAELDYLENLQKGLVLRASVTGFITDPKKLDAIVGQSYDPQKPIMKIAESGGEWYVDMHVSEEGANEINNLLSRGIKPKADFYLAQDKPHMYHGVVESISKSQDVANEDPHAERKVYAKVRFDISQLGLNEEHYHGSLRGAKVTVLVRNGYCLRIYYVTKGFHKTFWKNWHDLW